MEPLTAGVITLGAVPKAIATKPSKIAFGKTIEKLTQATLAKIKALGDKIWNKL